MREDGFVEEFRQKTKKVRKRKSCSGKGERACGSGNLSKFRPPK